MVLIYNNEQKIHRLCCWAVPSGMSPCWLDDASAMETILDSDGERIHEQVGQVQAKCTFMKWKYMLREGGRACSRGEQRGEVLVGRFYSWSLNRGRIFTGINGVFLEWGWIWGKRKIISLSCNGSKGCEV